MKYEDLYGVTLEEYAEAHGMSVEDIISQTRTDIVLLKKNYFRYAKRNHELTDDEQALVVKIWELVEKKKNHLEGMMKWLSSNSQKS